MTGYTNNKNLEYFMTACVLNRRQAHWNMSLSRFDFVIFYRPRNQQGLSDALFRRSYLAPKKGEAVYKQQWTTLLKAKQVHLCATTMSTPMDSSFLNQVRAASTMDPLVLDMKCRSDNNHEKLKFVDDLLYSEERLYIPEGPARLRVLQARHDFPNAGHFGFNKTWNSFLEIFGSPKYGRLSKNLCYLVTLAVGRRTLDIIRKDFYNHYQFQDNLGLLFPWTSSLIYHLEGTLLRYL
jgi:hypothetical protein